MENGYAFIDTFNDTVISKHRTEENAVRAAGVFHRRFKRNNTSDSYLTTKIVRIEGGKHVELIIFDYSTTYADQWVTNRVLIEED